MQLWIHFKSQANNYFSKLNFSLQIDLLKFKNVNWFNKNSEVTVGSQHVSVMKPRKAVGRWVQFISQVVSCHTFSGLWFCTYISFPLGHIFKCPTQRLLAYWTVHSRRVSSSQGVQGFVTALFTRTRGCILLSPVSPIDHCAWLAMNVQWTFTQRTGQVTASLIITGDVSTSDLFYLFTFQWLNNAPNKSQ